MRIGIDGLGMQSGSRERGIGRYLHDLTAALLKRTDCEIIVYASSRPGPTCIPPGVATRLLPGDYSAALQAASYDNRDHLDCLVVGSPFETHAGHTLPEQSGATVPLATIAYDMIPLRFPETYLEGDPYAAAYRQSCDRLKYYAGFLAISQSAGNDFTELLGVSPSTVIPIGAAVDHTFFFPGQIASADTDQLRQLRIVAPFILTMAQDESRKNLLGALDAFDLMPAHLKQHYQFVLLFPLQNRKRSWFDAQLRTRNLSHRLLRYDYVSNDHLRRLYRGCSAFLMPSHYEGFGLPLLEAMACGAPCIAGNNSSQPEVAGDAIPLVDTHNPAVMSAELVKVLTNSSLAATLRKAGADRAQQFTWDRVAENFLAAVSKISV